MWGISETPNKDEMQSETDPQPDIDIWIDATRLAPITMSMLSSSSEAGLGYSGV
jgi:hypothetical protein